MKIILLSTPEFFVEEDKLITAFFEEGLDVFHLRKPGTEPVYSERLLKLTPDEWHSKIVTHDFYYLQQDCGLKGIHVKNLADVPQRYSSAVTTSCHSIQELESVAGKVEYAFLSPVNNSISQPNKLSAFDADTLYQASRAGIINKKVVAAGGVSAENIQQLKDYGFGGVVICGDIWNRFSIHAGLNFKEIIEHFRKLRDAAR